MAKQKTLAIGILALTLILSLMSIANALVIESSYMSKNSIAPGESAKLTLVIKNNENIDLEDVSATLDFTGLPLAPYNSGSDYSINEILEGKSKQAEFDIIALNTATSGIYKIPVKIEYRDVDQAEGTPSKTKTSLVSVMINSEPIIEVTYEDGLLLKNQKNKVTVKVINKGLADVKFLEMEVKGSTTSNILSQSNVYIGDVDSNDFQTADFDIFFSNSAPSSVSLPVSITYKDITNKEYNKDFNLNLKVYDTQKAQELGLVAKSNTGTYVGIVIVLVIIFFIYRWFRNRRRKKEEY